MSNLKSTIEGLASQFAISIIGALRGASIEEIMSVTSGGSSRASAPVAAASPARARRPGRPAKAAAPAPAAPAPAESSGKKKAAGRPGRLGRRSTADIGKMIDDIVSLLGKHPDGLRAEQIRSSLGVQAKELPRPLADGLTAGRLTKSGQKRATTYFASGGASASPAKGGAKKAGGGKKKR